LLFSLSTIWGTVQDTNLVWYGIDFSRVKLIDKQSFNDVQKIKDQYFNSINLVVIGESKKYDLANNKNTHQLLLIEA